MSDYFAGEQGHGVDSAGRQPRLIVTRDSRIQDHRAEIESVRATGARMVALAGRDATNTWAQLEVVMTQWRAIERLLEDPGPYIYNATRSSLREVSLDP